MVLTLHQVHMGNSYQMWFAWTWQMPIFPKDRKVKRVKDQWKRNKAPGTTHYTISVSFILRSRLYFDQNITSPQHKPAWERINKQKKANHINDTLPPDNPHYLPLSLCAWIQPAFRLGSQPRSTFSPSFIILKTDQGKKKPHLEDFCDWVSDVPDTRKKTRIFWGWLLKRPIRLAIITPVGLGQRGCRDLLPVKCSMYPSWSLILIWSWILIRLQRRKHCAPSEP